MRFALLLILSFFFFASPFQGNAGKISGTQLTTNIENCTTHAVDCLVSDDYAVANISLSRSYIVTSQYRFSTFNNFINAVNVQNGANFFYEQNLFVEPNSYCKKIGLKLLFPKHYFW
jgi:hypothetical protein